MCGFVVWVSANHLVKQERLINSLKLLHHRGPDAQRFCFVKRASDMKLTDIFSYNSSKIPENPYFIGIGHTRLSIIDLSELSHQPLVSDDKRYCLVHNGEMYNYLEERSRLIDEKMRFTTEGDTEVLFKSLIRSGISAMSRINGMWAFAFFDFFKRQLVLSRDRYGKKPLFYYYDQKDFIASSEIKAIYSILNCRRKINRKYLYAFMVSKLIPTFDDGATLYEPIRLLQPGANLHFNLNDHSFRISHECNIDHVMHSYADIRDLEPCLETAVRERLRADVPIGIHVSGGVDSSIIAAYSAQYMPSSNDITYYTIRNIDGERNPKSDLHYSRLLAQQLGIKLKEIEISNSPNRILDDLAILARQYELPFNPFLSSYPGYLINKQIAEDGVKVVLDGTGGDEVIGGYASIFHHVAMNLAIQKKLGKALCLEYTWQRNCRKGLDQFKGMVWFLLRYLLKNRAIISTEERRLNDWHKFVRDPDFIVICEKLISEFFLRTKVESIKEYLKFEIKNFNLPYALYVNDQNAMMFSIENRSPLLDYRLAKFINVADNEKLKNGFNKYFLRKAMPKNISDDIRWRPEKVGMATSLFFSRKDYKQIRDTIFESQLLKSLIDLEKVKMKNETVEEGDLSGHFILRQLYPIALLGEEYECYV